MTNLIENAVKYGTPPAIELVCQDKTTTIIVRDRGPGIPSDALEHVFTPFYRLETSRNRSTGGVWLRVNSGHGVGPPPSGGIASFQPAFGRCVSNRSPPPGGASHKS